MNKPVLITFTGVDERTSVEDCAALSDDFPVEFGFLHSQKRTDPRYTGIPLLESFAFHGIKTAVHLCGASARHAIKNAEYPRFLDCAGRVQINLRDDEYQWDKLLTLGKILPTIRQTRDTNRWPLTPLNVAPLLDRSGGRGTEIQEWPAYTPAQLVGYAGGFRPGNVRAFTKKLHPHPYGYWIDMEAGVRTDDWFDTHKVLAVCQEIFAQ